MPAVNATELAELEIGSNPSHFFHSYPFFFFLGEAQKDKGTWSVLTLDLFELVRREFHNASRTIPTIAF
jgi:hypothetical protein